MQCFWSQARQDRGPGPLSLRGARGFNHAMTSTLRRASKAVAPFPSALPSALADHSRMGESAAGKARASPFSATPRTGSRSDHGPPLPSPQAGPLLADSAA